jgi:hypothetical protein
MKAICSQSCFHMVLNNTNYDIKEIQALESSDYIDLAKR